MTFGISRRTACQLLLASAASISGKTSWAAPQESPFKLNYSLASCMYGKLPLADILPEVQRSGADSIDLWPKVHGDQRDQVEEMGHDRFRELLQEHGVRLGMTTRYDLGPYKLEQEIKFVSSFGGKMIVTGAEPSKVEPTKELMQAFIKRLEPHAKLAADHGVMLAIENHGHFLLSTPDSLRYFADFTQSIPVGIALAPYHLPQDPQGLAKIIEDLGPKVVHFYAWEHGDGCMQKLPKEQELKQLPGRGTLDFGPILTALKQIQYSGWTQVFMHPFPRGFPILETIPEVTATINASRSYLSSLLPA